MSEKWTPGPWVINPHQQRIEWDGEWRNDGYIIAGEFLGPDVWWNLNLCAASPAMAEALEEIITAHSVWLASCHNDDDGGTSERLVKAIRNGEAALSLARGEAK